MADGFLLCQYSFVLLWDLAKEGDGQNEVA
jgi:hypothetical protein